MRRSQGDETLSFLLFALCYTFYYFRIELFQAHNLFLQHNSIVFDTFQQSCDVFKLFVSPFCTTSELKKVIRHYLNNNKNEKLLLLTLKKKKKLFVILFFIMYFVRILLL